MSLFDGEQMRWVQSNGDHSTEHMRGLASYINSDGLTMRSILISKLSGNNLLIRQRHKLGNKSRYYFHIFLGSSFRFT